MSAPRPRIGQLVEIRGVGDGWDGLRFRVAGLLDTAKLARGPIIRLPPPTHLWGHYKIGDQVTFYFSDCHPVGFGTWYREHS